MSLDGREKLVNCHLFSPVFGRRIAPLKRGDFTKICTLKTAPFGNGSPGGYMTHSFFTYESFKELMLYAGTAIVLSAACSRPRVRAPAPPTLHSPRPVPESSVAEVEKPWFRFLATPNPFGR